MFGLREAVEEGGLMSYGESLGRSHFRAAYFVDPAVYVPSTTFSVMHRDKLAQIALSHRLPTLYGFREFAEAGGLMSYGANLLDAYRRAATFVDKILKGSRPSDLPVEQPTRFELVINARTAKALGIEVPPTLVALADEVIE
jgi:putative tryptophan/tyrosine transport system substrate-binding protein